MEVHLLFKNTFKLCNFLLVQCTWGHFWSDWSECSRSCGGGIKSHIKQGGNFCTNERIENEACNTDLCPGNSISNILLLYRQRMQGLTFVHYWFAHWGMSDS